VADHTRRRSLVAIVGALSLIAFLPGTAQAATHTVHEKAHTVQEFTADGHMRKAPHVRADDITSVRATYRPHRLAVDVGLRGRDFYSGESYTFLVNVGTHVLVITAFTSPLDPRGTIFDEHIGFGSDRLSSPRAVHRLSLELKKNKDKAAGCSGLRFRSSARSVSVTIPQRCLGSAHKASVLPETFREKGEAFYYDDPKKSVDVRRG
jgi:hypothetical protein